MTDRPFIKKTHQAIIEDIRSASLDDCYRWSCARRVMPAHNGKPREFFSGDDYPWVREILNSRASYNWVMKGAQLGLTECGINRAFFEVDFHGKDTMYLLPTDKVAQLFSKTRLANAIKMSPYLESRVEDSLEVKQIGFSSLYIRGANGDINVKSTPVSRLVMDEIDEMKERQLWLGLERLAGQKDKLCWGMSTPTYPSHGIHKLFLKSTQEHFFFPCPSCKKKIELRWPDSFVIHGESLDDPNIHNSHLKCYECDSVLHHEGKIDWLKDGKWEATAVDADKETRGFTLNQLYSPTVSPGEIATAYFRGMGDEDARREFHNSKLGQPYVEDGAQVSDTHIDACVKDYVMDNCLPKLGDDTLYTLGMDQGAFHHWVVEKWTVDKSAMGDVNDRSRGRVIGIGRIAQDDWEAAAQLMRRFQIKMAVIDYHPDPTNARKFARRFPGYVWLCQYVVGRNPREIVKAEDDFGANIVKVDRTSWMSKSLGRIMTQELDLPADLPFEFRSQLKNQTRSYKRGVDGNYQAEYIKLGDDHFGHARNYSEIALALLDPALGDQGPITSIHGG